MSRGVGDSARYRAFSVYERFGRRLANGIVVVGGFAPAPAEVNSAGPHPDFWGPDPKRVPEERVRTWGAFRRGTPKTCQAVRRPITSSRRFGGRLGRGGLRVLLGALQLPFGVLFGAAFALAACGARILRASHSARVSSRGFPLCRPEFVRGPRKRARARARTRKPPRISPSRPAPAHAGCCEATPSS